MKEGDLIFFIQDQAKLSDLVSIDDSILILNDGFYQKNYLNFINKKCRRRGQDGRFVRDEGLNFNISIFTILKYLIVFVAIFQWFKLIEKTEILNIFDTSCPPCTECPPCFLPIGKFNRKPSWKLN